MEVGVVVLGLIEVTWKFTVKAMEIRHVATPRRAKISEAQPILCTETGRGTGRTNQFGIQKCYKRFDLIRGKTWENVHGFGKIGSWSPARIMREIH